jgi:hypothetical protein
MNVVCEAKLILDRELMMTWESLGCFLLLHIFLLRLDFQMFMLYIEP